jgi:ABC-2 type transport system permease protein
VSFVSREPTAGNRLGNGSGDRQRTSGPTSRQSSFSRSALCELTLARLREFFREPGALFWVFGFPLLMALVLGLAFRDRPPEKLPVGIVGRPGAGALSDAIRNSRTLRFEIYATLAQADRALRTGAVALVIEPGAPLRYRFDPTRPDARLARLEVDDAIQRFRGRGDAVAVANDVVHEKGARYIDFLMPGILGLNLMGTGMWGVGFAILTSRIRKTLRLLTATPMRKRDYLLCHIAARLVFLVFEVPLILVFGVFIFGVPIRGSLLLLAGISVLAAMTFSGIGLLTTSRARSLEVGSGLMNVVMIPMWLVSGSFFSYERFPKVFHPLIRALPLTAVNDALRAVQLDGRGIGAIGSEIGILAAWCVASFLAALKIFRWE